MDIKEAIKDFEETRKILKATKDDKWENHISQIDLAIEALEKAEKYRWHDLIKDPDDLPTEKNDYMCATSGWSNAIFYQVCTYFIDDDLWSPDCPTNYNNVIAWREIEPFKESEE